MKTLPTETDASAPTLLLHVDADGAIERWLLLDSSGVAGRGAGDSLPDQPWRSVLAVPGERVAIHWLDLADGLAPAQAAAAARLMLADASAEPLAALHLAVGRPERGLTPVALVPSAEMVRWLERTAAAGVEADSVVPTPLLLPVPETAHIVRLRGSVGDFRGAASAFSLEPELAAPLLGDEAVAEYDEATFEGEIAAIVAAPPIDLRQGSFARRRPWRLQGGHARRAGLLLLVLAVLSLAVQVATILSYTFAADRLRTEADALAVQGRGGAADGGPGFAAAAAVLFDAVRSTPNVELTRIEYRPDGSLAATIMLDAPATLDSLRGRIEARGFRAVAGETRTAGGRPTADLTVRA
ncbi:type II secretion system protein GspL [Sphingosinicella terrae]|uniref:type II secretion system protein GspL n=1 Tax=Sphingosinicella terrae TaxID=2172047 RepID=UPI0013B42790|nr:type II secretion system protein GspL [Sphingosinicella terrae]